MWEETDGCSLLVHGGRDDGNDDENDGGDDGGGYGTFYDLQWYGDYGEPCNKT